MRNSENFGNQIRQGEHLINFELYDSTYLGKISKFYWVNRVDINLMIKSNFFTL